MNAAKELFFDILNNGADLNQLCEVTSQLIGVPTALTIPTRTIIAKSTDYSEDLVAEYTSSLLLCTKDEIQKQTESLERIIVCKKAAVSVLPYLRHKRINCGCYYAGKLVGVVDCPIIDQTDEEKALQIVNLAAKVFTTAMFINGYFKPDETVPMQIYLHSVLEGSVSDTYQQKNLYESSLERIAEWRIIYVAPVDQDSLLQLTHKIYGFTSQTTDIWGVEYGCGTVVLFSEAAYQEEHDAFIELCSEYARIAISDSYSDILNTPEQYAMCKMALQLSMIEDVEDSIVFVKKYKIVFQFLLFIQDDPKKIYFNHTVNDIISYDRKHGTEYYPTLKAYLLCEQNASFVADRLHVHKNTVNYRIQRLEELFELNLKDCRVITDLYLELMQHILFE